MLAALAADAPEITASVTALAGHHSRIGAGVVIGSNVFNLAALLGLSALVAGEIKLHPRVIIFEGTVAMLIAVVSRRRPRRPRTRGRSARRRRGAGPVLDRLRCQPAAVRDVRLTAGVGALAIRRHRRGGARTRTGDPSTAGERSRCDPRRARHGRRGRPPAPFRRSPPPPREFGGGLGPAGLPPSRVACFPPPRRGPGPPSPPLLKTTELSFLLPGPLVGPGRPPGGSPLGPLLSRALPGVVLVRMPRPGCASITRHGYRGVPLRLFRPFLFEADRASPLDAADKDASMKSRDGGEAFEEVAGDVAFERAQWLRVGSCLR